MLRRRIFIGLLAALVAFSFATVGCLYWLFNFEMPRVMSDFAALWNSTDALTHHVQIESEWPRNWSELAPSLEFVDASTDQAFVEERVIVNFQVELDTQLPKDEWFIRLKSGGMPPEVENANQRIRKFIEWHQTKASNEAVPGSIRQP